MKRCPTCQTLQADKFCTKDGTDLRKEPQEKCQCGALKYDSDNHCGHCGRKHEKDN
jgi:hypothetical protein